MAEVKTIGGKKAVIFAESVDPKAMAQFCEAMKVDTTSQGALMPDAHAGYTLPIGAVIASDGVVYPSYVGYDIGCGMCAVPTSFDVEDVRAKTEEIFNGIYNKVPVGFKVNDDKVGTKLDPANLTARARKAFETRGAFYALGTLGGGNHFIEVGADERTNKVWLIVHSGSRGVGHGIATAYLKLASPDGKAREGHFGFDARGEDGKAYINDLNWTLKFALGNRHEIIKRVVAVLATHCSGEASWDDLINRNHNHAEERDGKWIHRKGATHAEKGMMGVIPGNMRDGSFIVRGKGNPDALYSSSHGAGRVLGRNQARKTLDVEEFKSEMVGIKAKVGKSTLDESPMAYKDVFEVMRLQKELVEVCARIVPIINVKG